MRLVIHPRPPDMGGWGVFEDSLNLCRFWGLCGPVYLCPPAFLMALMTW